jgi:ubiquinone/menaquinone biosynthesis C-methylase UbiE
MVVDAEMRAYYDRRAQEYDDWWLGVGQPSSVDRPGWREDTAALVAAIRGLPPARVLDVACGTGFLTQHLQGEVVALDQSPRMLEVAAARLPQAQLVHGEAVPLPFPDSAFDRVFTGHFYGHLLPGEREAFVAEARRVGRELVVVDSAGQGDEWQERTLSDGSRHRVFTRRFAAAQLADELGGGTVLHEGPWFVAVAA